MKIPRRVPRSRRALAVAAGLALVAGTVATAGAVTAAPGGGAAAPPITVDRGAVPAVPDKPVEQRKAPSSATVTLVTGDRFRVETGADGAQRVSALGGGSAEDAQYSMFGFNGDKYVIPNVVAPYLASSMDIRLFDVSYLVRAKLDDAHAKTLPVAVTGRSGVALPSLSGASGRTTMAKKNTPSFGRMLATQWRASRSGASDTPVGKLPGGGKLTLTRADGAPALPTAPTMAGAAKPAATGGVPYRTVTLDPIDRDGNVGTMVGLMQSVDDLATGWLRIEYPGMSGASSFSVPEGRYSLQFAVMNGPADDLDVDSSLVIKPEVAINGDTTVTLDARQAKPYQVKVDSVPADYQTVSYLSFTRESARNGSLRVQAFGFDSYWYYIAMHMIQRPGTYTKPLYVTPTDPVSTGTMNFAAQTEFVESVSGMNPDPRYRLFFPSQGKVPASLSHHVTDADLTTVHTSIHDRNCAGCTSTDQAMAVVFTPWSQNNLGNGAKVPAGDRTDYWYSGEPGLTAWQAEFNGNDGNRRLDARRRIEPGETINEDWNRGPAVPAPNVPYSQLPIGGIGGPGENVTDPWAALCGACRQDDNGVLYLQPMADASPGHYADASYGAEKQSLRFSRNGTLVLSSDAQPDSELSPYGYPLPLLPTAADYELQWAYQVPKDTSQRVDTTWKFRSGPDDPAATLTDGQQCAPDPDRSCSYLPLLYVGYDLPLDATSQTAAGAAYTFGFHVTGQLHSAQRGTAASVAVSYDDGATWTESKAATAKGDGEFSATIQHPELAGTNGFVSLRVTAHDADGNSVTQTTVRAYALK